MKGSAIFLALAGACAGITLYVFHLDETLGTARTTITPVSDTGPDATFRNAIIRLSNNEGTELYRIHTPFATHYTDGHARLEQPVTIIDQGEQSPWRLQSVSATLMPDVKQAILHGKVNADREATPLNDNAHVVSEDVTIDYNSHYAYSDAFTTITRKHHTTSGTGMDAWFETPSRIRLRSEVKGTYLR